MSGYVSADTLAGHPLSGSGKLVPDQRTFPPHVEKYVATNNSTFYGCCQKIWVKTAGTYSFYNATGSDKVDFGNVPVGIYNLQPTAWSGSNADGSIVFIYRDSSH